MSKCGWNLKVCVCVCVYSPAFAGTHCAYTHGGREGPDKLTSWPAGWWHTVTLIESIALSQIAIMMKLNVIWLWVEGLFCCYLFFAIGPLIPHTAEQCPRSHVKNSLVHLVHHSPNFAGAKESEIWSRFSTPVAFESPSSRNGATYLKSITNWLSIDDGRNMVQCRPRNRENGDYAPLHLRKMNRGNLLNP